LSADLQVRAISLGALERTRPALESLLAGRTLSRGVLDRVAEAVMGLAECDAGEGLRRILASPGLPPRAFLTPGLLERAARDLLDGLCFLDRGHWVAVEDSPWSAWVRAGQLTLHAVPGLVEMVEQGDEVTVDLPFPLWDGWAVRRAHLHEVALPTLREVLALAELPTFKPHLKPGASGRAELTQVLRVIEACVQTPDATLALRIVP